MTNFNDVTKGDLMAVVKYATVSSLRGDGRIDFTDIDDGEDFSVIGRSLVEKMFSADRYEKELKVTRTQMAETLSRSFNVPFTVTFEKQDGTTRRLRGRLIEPERLMGRCKVEDLDIEENNFRLVDNRTITELIVGGIKYTLK